MRRKILKYCGLKSYNIGEMEIRINFYERRLRPFRHRFYWHCGTSRPPIGLGDISRSRGGDGGCNTKRETFFPNPSIIAVSLTNATSVPPPGGAIVLRLLHLILITLRSQRISPGNARAGVPPISIYTLLIAAKKSRGHISPPDSSIYL